MQRPSPPTVAASLLVGAASCLYFSYASATPAGASPASAQQFTIDADRELFIIDPRVVDSDRAYLPGGAWHFGELMSQMSGTVDPSSFVEAWMDSWSLDPNVVNGRNVFDAGKGQAMTQFEAKWPKRADGQVDLDLAPFRLLAIVNRPDLLQLDPNGIPTQAAELRFIYGFLEFDSMFPTEPAEWAPKRPNVIFEYGVPASSWQDVIAWQERWHELADHQPGSEDYLAALESITLDITIADSGSGLTNGSLLNQLRTNEFLLATSSPEWDLREFQIVSPGGGQDDGLLVNVTVKQNPHQVFIENGQTNRRHAMGRWWHLNRQDILAGRHVVPLKIPKLSGGSFKFLGGASINEISSQIPPPDEQGTIDTAKPTKWWAEGFTTDDGQHVSVENAEVRHRFALQTCSGCHGEETNAPDFRIVHNRAHGAPSLLAGFLTGTGPVEDPVNPIALDANGNEVAVWHSFDDLANRESIMQRILAFEPNGGPGPDGLTPPEVLAEIVAEMGTRVH